jgi:hypothetical protein
MLLKLKQHRAYLLNVIDTSIPIKDPAKRALPLSPPMLINQPDIPRRVPIAAPQDRASAERDSNMVFAPGRVGSGRSC